jgi:hypothetical protein
MGGLFWLDSVYEVFFWGVVVKSEGGFLFHSDI